MTAKHTPGPWKIKGHGPSYAGYGISDSAGRSIAAMPSTQKRSPEEKQANATLIVAAPELARMLLDCIWTVLDEVGQDAENWPVFIEAEQILASLEYQTESMWPCPECQSRDTRRENQNDTMFKCRACGELFNTDGI